MYTYYITTAQSLALVMYANVCREALSPAPSCGVSVMDFPVKARAGQVEDVMIGPNAPSPPLWLDSPTSSTLARSSFLSFPSTTRPGRLPGLFVAISEAREAPQFVSCSACPIYSTSVQSCWIEHPYIFSQNRLLDICSPNPIPASRDLLSSPRSVNLFGAAPSIAPSRLDAPPALRTTALGLVSQSPYLTSPSGAIP